MFLIDPFWLVNVFIFNNITFVVRQDKTFLGLSRLLPLGINIFLHFFSFIYVFITIYLMSPKEKNRQKKMIHPWFLYFAI